jgi:protein-S-isoprenylcysteine O-methyltransferase Ste14
MTSDDDRGPLKWIDLPPVWLAVFLGLAWLVGDRLPMGGGGVWSDLLGGLLVGGGVLLMALAVFEMRRMRTTVIPHRTPDALVSSGIYRRTRNPIYLGDGMILTGLILYWAAWPALVLVPLFAWLITDRFIQPEEARLHDAFGDSYVAYAALVRRWM